jgi:hypothetical protein
MLRTDIPTSAASCSIVSSFGGGGGTGALPSGLSGVAPEDSLACSPFRARAAERGLAGSGVLLDDVRFVCAIHHLTLPCFM